MSFLSYLASLLLPEPGARLAPAEARLLLSAPAQERPKVLDVRTSCEWKKGRIQGAVLADISTREFDQRVAALPREGRYLIYCHSGSRSRVARARMKAMGFTDVAHLSGGLSAWRAARLPVVK